MSLFQSANVIMMSTFWYIRMLYHQLSMVYYSSDPRHLIQKINHYGSHDTLWMTKRHNLPWVQILKTLSICGTKCVFIISKSWHIRLKLCRIHNILLLSGVPICKNTSSLYLLDIFSFKSMWLYGITWLIYILMLVMACVPHLIILVNLEICITRDFCSLGHETVPIICFLLFCVCWVPSLYIKIHKGPGLLGKFNANASPRGPKGRDWGRRHFQIDYLEWKW